MTLIIHRCRTCGHPGHVHASIPGGETECSWGHCRAGRHFCDLGPSEYLATYRTDTGTVTTTVTPPGTGYTAFGARGAINTCACDECQTLYRQWVGVA